MISVNTATAYLVYTPSNTLDWGAMAIHWIPTVTVEDSKISFLS